MNNKPSSEKPWLKYYGGIVDKIEVPNCSLFDFIKMRNPDDTLEAIRFYDNKITFKELYENSINVAKSLKAMNFKEGDQIPVFLLSVPEFIYLLLGAELIGASVISREGSPCEILETISDSCSDTVFVHDYLSKEEEIAFRKNGIKNIIYISPTYSALKIGDTAKKALNARYPDKLFDSEKCTSWQNFLRAGKKETLDYVVSDFNKPLSRSYTTGTTGTSKQVIHSAHSIIGVLVQMSFYPPNKGYRLKWESGIFPPSLVATIISMMFAPLVSNTILVLNPLVMVEDYDLALMENKSNIFPLIPLTSNVLLNSNRIPDDFDLSFLVACGAGAEFSNNKLIKQMNEFFKKHNSNATYTIGYGMSECGSNILLPIPHVSSTDCCAGIPMPLDTIGVFEQGTDNELGYNELGEICKSGEGLMVGYKNPEDTEKIMFVHSDGKTWLHTGDIGYISEDGFVHVLNRGYIKHYTGENLFVYQMENKIIDIEGIHDAFFLTKEDENHEGYFLPYLYLILDDDNMLEEVSKKVKERLLPHEQPIKIFTLKERPFFHMKTARRFLAEKI